MDFPPVGCYKAVTFPAIPAGAEALVLNIMGISESFFMNQAVIISRSTIYTKAIFISRLRIIELRVPFSCLSPV
jgi:hypothetical protein